jgi:hypothetical protein
LFNQWASISSKPFFFGEFGIDAFHATALQNPNPPGMTNENEQADWVLNLWTEIARNSSEGNSTNVCIGGAAPNCDDTNSCAFRFSFCKVRVSRRRCGSERVAALCEQQPIRYERDGSSASVVLGRRPR